MTTVRELTARFTAQYNGMRTTLRAMGNELRTFGRDSQRQLDGTNNSFRDLENAAGQAQDEIEELDNTTLARLQRELDETAESMDEIEQSNADMGESSLEAESVMVGAFGNIGLGAAALVGAVAGVVASVVGLVKQGDELQKALNSLEQQTGATVDEMESMETSLKAIYERGYGESFQDIADTMAYAKQATGFFGEELEFLAQDALMLRDTFGMEVTESIRGADSLFEQFGLTGTQSMAMIAEAQQKGLNRNDDLIDTIEEYSIYFANAGMSAEEMFAVLENASAKGVRNIDYVGDAVKEFGIIMKEDSERATDALKKMGLPAEKLQADFAKGGKGAKETFQTIIKELGKMKDPLERNKLGVELFGTKFEDLEADAVLAMGNLNGSIKGSFETLDKINELKFDDVGSALSGMGRIFQTHVILPLQEKVMPYLNKTANFLRDNLPQAIDAGKQKFGEFKEGVKAVVDFLEPYVIPIIEAVVSFIGEKLAQLAKFWDENGAQIVQACKNAFNFILSIIQFIMPAVLAIIKMVWGNIKGVIDGALKIIMGLIKVFAGIFTGDFSKMWEGVKQLFKGAIQFVWNLLNLLFIGKILKGIGGLVTSAKNLFTNLWDDTVRIFKNLDSSVTNVVGKFVRYLRNSWNTARDNAVGIFTNIKNTISKIWDDIVSGARNLPGKIGNGIREMAGKASDGVRSLANKLVGGLEKGVNGVIGGVNWVLGKVNVPEDKHLTPWEAPRYKKGTGNHPGGLAVLGDGGQQELIVTPDGKMSLSPDTDTLMNLPKGTAVLSGEKTREFLKGLLPAYKDGDGTSLSDIWSMITNPTKLLGKVLKDRGVSFELPGPFSKAAGGILKKITSGAVGWLKEKLKDIGGFFGGGASAVGSGVKRWSGVASQALMMTGQSTKANLDRLLYQMKTESGGNPRAINLWDINAKRGIPSKGLMQVIDPTFRAYAMPGFDKNVYDPLSNILASIRYALSRYGSLANAYRGKGYWKGARVAMKQLAWIAEKGAEYVIPTDGGPRAYQLWKDAGAENGFSSGVKSSTNAQFNSGNVESLLTELIRTVKANKDVYIDGEKVTDIINGVNAVNSSVGRYMG